ncbi:Do family serine endopeptidase [Ignatzschineria sp. RMDPL8A]|uniref:Do family serine endopeptidase n=1 Tax=Ignatzschineria sp. RMDPL8A TaxID=2999236 RepID=UPI0024465E73|nr:Do family serine endopeptidase [Ignatzschineria sp. RMDPL8A]MDG9730059.1 Do family serine endopeptidase [Ignatzschineria sp. RMDPL8A]
MRKLKQAWLPFAWVIMTFLTFTAVANADNRPPDWSLLFEENKAAIVSITTEGTEKVQIRSPFDGFPFGPSPFGSPFGEDDPFSFFFGTPNNTPKEQERIVRGAGSGFIIDSEAGIIVTNAHVVEKADDITVHFFDRREAKAELIGQDERSDVAVLKVALDQNSPLQEVTIGDVETLKVGQWVMAVGSPFGLDYTATQGIISSLGRNLPNDHYTPFIQTDAAINPGNSGGPLFNTKGEVIGINSQIYTSTGSYAGVSFAIPIDLVMDVVAQIQTHGKVTHGWLGVQVQEVTPALAKTFGMEKPEGALVADVVKGGPADKAKLKSGDIILAFNGKKVRSSSNLPMQVARANVGDKAELLILRKGKEKTLTVTIEASDSDKTETVTGSNAKNSLNVVVENHPNYPKEKGVLVKNVGKGIAMTAGIRAGDIIVQINNDDTDDVESFKKALEKTSDDAVIRLLVKRNGNPFFIAITKPVDAPKDRPKAKGKK